MIILGIDPGTVRAGYGLIKKENGRLSYIKSGLLRIKSADKQKRLLELEKSVRKIMEKHKPDLVALEQLYFAKNQKTAIEVAQARGVIMLLAVKSGLAIKEVAPSTVKSAVAGYGLASKNAVSKMVSYFLQIDTSGKIDDETDALAIAIAAC